MNIFLDDERPTPKGFELSFKDGKSLLTYLREHPNEHYEVISFDHDLGNSPFGGKYDLDGYDVIKTIVEDPSISFTFDRWQFHTANFTGFENMYYYLNNAVKNGMFENPGFVDPVKKNAFGDFIIDSLIVARDKR